MPFPSSGKGTYDEYFEKSLVKFMLEHGIDIPQPTLIKAVLQKRIRMVNIKKRYIIDKMALEKGGRVLRLPPYHCCLNAIEMVWHQLKSNIRRQNVYSDKPEKVLDLIRDVCDELTPEDWSNCVQHVLKGAVGSTDLKISKSALLSLNHHNFSNTKLIYTE